MPAFVRSEGSPSRRPRHADESAGRLCGWRLCRNLSPARWATPIFRSAPPRTSRGGSLERTPSAEAKVRRVARHPGREGVRRRRRANWPSRSRGRRRVVSIPPQWPPTPTTTRPTTPGASSLLCATPVIGDWSPARTAARWTSWLRGRETGRHRSGRALHRTQRRRDERSRPLVHPAARLALGCRAGGCSDVGRFHRGEIGDIDSHCCRTAFTFVKNRKVAGREAESQPLTEP